MGLSGPIISLKFGRWHPRKIAGKSCKKAVFPCFSSKNRAFFIDFFVVGALAKAMEKSGENLGFFHVFHRKFVFFHDNLVGVP